MRIWIIGWPVCVTLACAVAAAWVLRQPVYDHVSQAPRPGPIRMLVGLILRPGVPLGQGSLWAMTGWAWAFWNLLGLTVLLTVLGFTKDWKAIPVVYGILGGLASAVAGAVLGIVLGVVIVTLTNMSGFEGKAGIFVAAMMAGGAIIGLIAGTIGFTLYFHGR